MEPWHPCALYPDDVIHNIIDSHPIYVVNEGLFIYHTLLTFHINAIYKIYNNQIRYVAVEVRNSTLCQGVAF